MGACFQCGKEGHRATDCLAPHPMSARQAPSKFRTKKSVPKSKEKTKITQQVMEISSPSSEGEDDPMVSGPISPMTTRVELCAPREYTALLDWGAQGQLANGRKSGTVAQKVETTHEVLATRWVCYKGRTCNLCH